MKSENTVYDQNEETQFDTINKENLGKNEVKEDNKSSRSKNVLKGEWRTVAVGTGTGLIFGAAGSILTNEVYAEVEGKPEPVSPDPEPQPHHEVTPVVDSEIATATSVNDNMSFSQAFAAARAEVGSGGVFEWHGNLYGTYYAEEWDALTPEQKAEYNNHFAWSNAETSQTQSENIVSHPENPTNNEHTAIVEEDEDDVEVEVLGVVHDENSGMNYGAMKIDGNEAYVVDVDGDLKFDILAIDFNSDGQVQENEVTDISSQQLTVEHMGGFMDQEGGSLTASVDEVDYANEDISYEN